MRDQLILAWQVAERPLVLGEGHQIRRLGDQLRDGLGHGLQGWVFLRECRQPCRLPTGWWRPQKSFGVVQHLLIPYARVAGRIGPEHRTVESVIRWQEAPADPPCVLQIPAVYIVESVDIEILPSHDPDRGYRCKAGAEENRVS